MEEAHTTTGYITLRLKFITTYKDNRTNTKNRVDDGYGSSHLDRASTQFASTSKLLRRKQLHLADIKGHTHYTRPSMAAYTHVYYIAAW